MPKFLDKEGLNLVLQNIKKTYASKEELMQIDSKFGGKAFIYLTQEEYNKLSEQDKNNDNIVYSITDVNEKIPTKLSDLENDKDFVQKDYVDEQINNLNLNNGNAVEVDLSGYVKQEELDELESGIGAMFDKELIPLLNNKAPIDHNHEEIEQMKKDIEQMKITLEEIQELLNNLE